MKTLIVLASLMVISTTSQAALYSNEDCVKVYRDGALELKKQADLYNDAKIDANNFSLNVSATSTKVAAKRFACSFIESGEVKSCVDSAKKLYDIIRDTINVKAVLAGNQSEVNYKKTFVAHEKIHNLKCRKYN